MKHHNHLDATIKITDNNGLIIYLDRYSLTAVKVMILLEFLINHNFEVEFTNDDIGWLLINNHEFSFITFEEVDSILPKYFNNYYQEPQPSLPPHLNATFNLIKYHWIRYYKFHQNSLVRDHHYYHSALLGLNDAIIKFNNTLKIRGNLTSLDYQDTLIYPMIIVINEIIMGLDLPNRKLSLSYIEKYSTAIKPYVQQSLEVLERCWQ